MNDTFPLRIYLMPVRVVFAVLIVFLAASAAMSQTAAGAAGASASGYGRAYEAAGGSAAAKQVQKKIGSVLKGAVGGGSAAKPRNAPKGSASRGRQMARPAPRTPSATTTYRPDPSIDVASTLADSIGSNAQEKEILHALFVTTKTAFDEEVAKKGRRNSVSAAFTFFIASASMVYHNSPEPSDEAVDALWNALDASFQEMPEFAEMSDMDKQQISDTLVALSGLMILGHPQYNPSLNAETQRGYREVAGNLIRTVLQTDPEKLRFGKDGLLVD
ncbi:MAG: hypothetical protein KF855_08700 [Acidobacteria bacterium]|nr:hypothetical protein [Acidobacteriota bacterium]